MGHSQEQYGRVELTCRRRLALGGPTFADPCPTLFAANMLGTIRSRSSVVVICWVASCSALKYVTAIGTFCRFCARRCAVTVTSSSVSVELESAELDCGSASAALGIAPHMIQAASAAHIVFRLLMLASPIP